MLNSRSLLDQLLGQVDLSSISGGGADRSGADAQQQGTPTNQFGQIGGVNLDSLLSGKGGLATGAVAGGLVGLLMGGKKPKKIAKSALKMGGAALIGGLAYKAWKDYQSGSAPGGGFNGGATAHTSPSGSGDEGTPLPIEDASDTPFLPKEQAEQDALSQSLIAAMVGAAKADGHITHDERQRISAALDHLNLSGDHRQFIEAELEKPLDVGAIAATATTDEHKVELYAASLIAVDPEGPAEKGYLAMLAARLGLDPRLVEHLHANADRLLVTS